MRKIYYLATGLIISAGSFAQIQQGGPVQRASTASNMEQTHHQNAQDRAPGDVIETYEDDFTTPANWILTNTSVPAKNFTINSVGPGSAPDIINSTSGGNFAWYDCDPQGTGSSVNAMLTYGTVFDLTGYPAVSVSFEQFYQDYYENTYVEVSVNGLAGPWTQYEVNEEYLPNAPSPVNPVTKLVNISSLAGNQPNVAVRFNYTGGWGWSWQIDDFALVEAYENDLSIMNTRFSSGVEGNEYYMIPTNQVTEFTFGARIKSNGINVQTDTYMHVQVDGGTEYDEVSIQSEDIALNAIDSFSIETPNGWTPGGAGTYDLEMIAVTDDYTDQNAPDNVMVHEPIIVGGTTYARDNGIITSGFTGFTSTAGEPIQAGNTFEFFNDAVFGVVHIGVTTSATNEGQLLYAAVYRWSDDIMDFEFVTQSEDHVITGADLGGIVEFHLAENVEAEAGEVYLVCAGNYGGDPMVYFAEAQPTHEGSVFGIASAGTLLAGTPSALIIRAVFEPTQVGLDEVSATAFTAYPNPANDQFTIQYNLMHNATVSLVITDATGKLVQSVDFGAQSEGAYKTTVDTRDMSNGIYFYTLVVDGETLVKKLTVSKN
jgi:hypothetical protein